MDVPGTLGTYDIHAVWNGSMHATEIVSAWCVDEAWSRVCKGEVDDPHRHRQDAKSRWKLIYKRPGVAMPLQNGPHRYSQAEHACSDRIVGETVTIPPCSPWTHDEGCACVAHVKSSLCAELRIDQYQCLGNYRGARCEQMIFGGQMYCTWCFAPAVYKMWFWTDPDGKYRKD